VKAESPAVSCRPAHSCPRTCATARPQLAVCTENLIRVDDAMELPKLAG
jgi:hypothetical protein